VAKVKRNRLTLALCHPTSVAMATKEPDAKAKPPAQTAREQRLAQALRDNLRRRKAGAEGMKTQE
jgi:hypothetical protein